MSNAGLSERLSIKGASRLAAMGIDVSLTRGLDVVVVTSDRAVVFGPVKVAPGDLRSVIREESPDVVAIDGPPAWAASGKSRAVERQLFRLGISIYATPSEPAGRSFYGWMEEAFRAFGAAAAEGYLLYRGLPTDQRNAIEVFPHASAVAIHGGLPATGEPKIGFRRAALERVGLVSDVFRTADQIDATLAAFTGLRFLEGGSCNVGAVNDAVLVMPTVELPTRYRRGASRVGAAGESHSKR